MIARKTLISPAGCLRVAVLAGSLTGPLSVLCPATSCADYTDDLGRRYSLTGSLEVSYDRLWSQGGEGTTDFRQLLLLDHRGFVLDPQLIGYQVAARVSHDGGKGSGNSTLAGADASITLMRSVPEGLQSWSDYIPHPIWVRYSRETDNLTDYTSYGISFNHSVSKKKFFLEIDDITKDSGDADEGTKPAKDAAAGKEGDKAGGSDGKASKDEDADLYDDGPTKTMKIVEKDGNSFPVTFFDYDHFDEKSPDSHTINDILSLRSALTGKTYDYRFLYENQNQSGSEQLQRKLLQLEPNYHFYDEKTKRQIDLRNMVKYESYNRAQNIEAGSDFNWSKPLGKDQLLLGSALQYADNSADRLSQSRYDARVSANYQKFLSQRVSSNTQVLSSFRKTDSVDSGTDTGKKGTVDYHSERLSETVTADLSRLYNGLAIAYLGYGVQGIEYGTSATITSKTRITTFITYAYDLAVSQAPVTAGLTGQSQPNAPAQYSTAKLSKHDVTIGASGPILNNLAIQTRGEFALRDQPVTGGTSTEQDDLLSANLLWRVYKTSLALGGNIGEMKKAGTASSSKTLFSTFTRILPMKMLFNFYSTWTKTDDSTATAGGSSTTRLELRPTLRWTRGLTTLDTEYSYTRSTGGGNASVDQRFFARVIRKFSALF